MRRACPTCGGIFTVSPSKARKGQGKFCSAACVRREPPPAPRRPADLGPRRRAVVALVAGGLTRPEVAAALGISVHTVRTHVERTYRQLDLRNAVELANWCHDHR